MNDAIDMEVRYLGDLQKISLNPGDTVVLMSNALLSQDDCTRIHQYLEHTFPDNKCIVLGDGLKIGVLGADKPGGE